MKDKKKLILIVGGSVIALIAIAVVVYFAAFYNKSYRIIKLEDYSGSVEVLRRNNPIDLFNGLQLVSGDSSAIGEDSLMLLLIDSDKHMMVSENTKFSVVATGSEENGKVVIDITDGRASFAIDNKLGEESTFEVHTPNATTSIRGTVFTVSYEPLDNQTVVAVDDGTVDVEYGDGKHVIVNGTEIAYVKSDNADVSKSDVLYFFDIEDFGDELNPWYSEYLGDETGYGNGRFAELSSDTLKELYFDVMSEHRDEITAYENEVIDPIYEEYGEKGMTEEEWNTIHYKFERKNITYWFPSEFEMDIGDGTRTFKIDRVELGTTSLQYKHTAKKQPRYIDVEGKVWAQIDPFFGFYIHEVENG